MIESNYSATQQGTSVKYNAISSTFFVVPLAGVIIFLMYFVNEDQKNMQTLISLTVVPFMTVLIIYVGFMFRLMLKRWNQTINKISIDSNNLSIETFSIFWYKVKKYTVKISNVTVKKANFQWYGKEKKDGLVINVGREELYFVKDYFDEPESILTLLRNV